MEHEVWIFDGRAPELLCRAPSLPAARARWGYSRHAAIFDGAGELVDTKRETDPKRLAAIEAARAGRAAPPTTSRPLPRATATEPTPPRAGEPSAPVEAPAAPAASEVVPPVPPAKATRPAATRPPLPRRRVAPDAAPAPTSSTVVAETPATPAAPPAAEPAAPPQAAEDSPPDRAPAPDPATAHRIEQLRGEVEALTTDLGLARRDLATTVRQLNELSDRTRAELAQITAERDEARDLLSLAMSTGLAAVLEARAETEAVLRQSAALSRELGSLRDARDSTPPAAPRVELDEAVLERVAARAARIVLRGSRDDQRLRALAERVGGVDALARMVGRVEELLRGWSS